MCGQEKLRIRSETRQRLQHLERAQDGQRSPTRRSRLHFGQRSAMNRSVQKHRRRYRTVFQFSITPTLWYNMHVGNEQCQKRESGTSCLQESYTGTVLIGRSP